MPYFRYRLLPIILRCEHKTGSHASSWCNNAFQTNVKGLIRW